MEFIILIPAIFIAGAVLGYWLCAHIHTIAASAAKAVSDAAGKV